MVAARNVCPDAANTRAKDSGCKHNKVWGIVAVKEVPKAVLKAKINKGTSAEVQQSVTLHYTPGIRSFTILTSDHCMKGKEKR